MLTALEVENFKGIGRPIRIEFRPITLLFGPNSAGKSTVLHVLLYAHEILSRRNLDPDQTHHGSGAVDLGGFRNFVHRHETERAVRLRFELDLRDSELPEFPTPAAQRPKGPANTESAPAEDLEYYNDGLDDKVESGWVALSIQWSAARARPILREFEIGINGEKVGRIEASADGAQVNLFPNLPHPLFEHDGRRSVDQLELELPESGWSEGTEREYWEGHHLPVGNLGRSSLPRWGELLDVEYDESDDFYAYPFREFRYRASTLIVGVGQLLRDEIARLRYIGPVRDVPARAYTPPRYLEPHRWASGLGAWDLMFSRGAEFVSQVSDWLTQASKLDSGYGLEFKSLIELPEDSALWISIDQGTFLDVWDDFVGEFASLETRKELRLVSSENRVVVYPSDVGVGISQVIPVVVAAVDPDRPTLTAIEQPELHIHPKVQVGLGDLFASQIGDGTRCLLLETHSEHLMLRLLRRIEQTHSRELGSGEPPLRPEQVSVVFIEQSEGEVKASQLRIDEAGEFIDRWPHGFFDERAKELL